MSDLQQLEEEEDGEEREKRRRERESRRRRRTSVDEHTGTLGLSPTADGRENWCHIYIPKCIRPFKMGKGLNRHFSKEDIKMGDQRLN